MRQSRKRTDFPQLRNFAGQRRSAGLVTTERRNRFLPLPANSGAGVPKVWFAVSVATLLLLMIATAPVWLPALSWFVPDRYIMAYAPEPIQKLVFQVNVHETVPTPIASQSAEQAANLLEQLAPTPTPTPTQPEGPITYIQPTPVALAPTATFTPVYSADVSDSARDRDNEANLAEATELLQGFDFEQQGYNNCGPASIRVLMSYWNRQYDDVVFTEQEAASFLKPNREDPNVRPDEIAAFVEQYGYHALVRQGGDLQLIQNFILAGYPVLIETGYDPEPETIGWTSHYLTIVGYSDEDLIVMDTYRRPNWAMKINEVDHFWRQFNRRYIIVYRPEQYALVASIIGADMDEATNLENSLTIAHNELSLNQNDAFAWFNLGSTLTAQGRYDEAAVAFDEARRQELPWRMLWYQFEPYEAYLQVGRYEDVIALADDVLQSKQSEEAYYYKGLALEALGKIEQAKVQIRNAVRFNNNFELAKLALERLED